MPDTFFKSSKDILVVDRDIKVRSWDSKRFVYIFDFEFRTMTVITDYGSAQKESTAVRPFSEVDPEVLGRMHDKLVSLGGEPPPLERNPAIAKILSPPLRKGGMP